MTPRIRAAVIVVAAAALFFFAWWGASGLPPYGAYPGPYGTLLDELAPSQRKIPNVITAVNFDYRGLDTLGEENILFAAVAGITLVLRADRRRTREEPLPAAAGRPRMQRTEAIRAFAIVGIALTVAYGAYMLLHPHLTPGGGFQGGTILAGFAALAFLGLGFRALRTFARQDPTETVESIGAGGYTVVGLATLAAAGSFLANALPLGEEGAFFSTGTIPVINFCVAVEVCAGFMILFLEFARETRVEEAEE